MPTKQERIEELKSALLAIEQMIRDHLKNDNQYQLMQTQRRELERKLEELL